MNGMEIYKALDLTTTSVCSNQRVVEGTSRARSMMHNTTYIYVELDVA